jgi:hypothetical protein
MQWAKRVHPHHTYILLLRNVQPQARKIFQTQQFTRERVLKEAMLKLHNRLDCAVTPINAVFLTNVTIEWAFGHGDGF